LLFPGLLIYEAFRFVAALKRSCRRNFCFGATQL